MYINRKDFEKIYTAYFIMTDFLADFDNPVTEEEDDLIIDGQKKLIEILRNENRKKGV